jgi:hypothetical protein
MLAATKRFLEKKLKNQVLVMKISVGGIRIKVALLLGMKFPRTGALKEQASLSYLRDYLRVVFYLP